MFSKKSRVPVFGRLKKVPKLCPFCAHGKTIEADFYQLMASEADSERIEIARK
jgi:hypothetical protein